MFRKDKYEPKDLTKLKFAFEEEVEGVKQNAEQEEYMEDTVLAEGDVDQLPLGLEDLVGSDNSEKDDESAESSEEERVPSDAKRRQPKRPKSKNDGLEEKLPTEDPCLFDVQLPWGIM